MKIVRQNEKAEIARLTEESDKDGLYITERYSEYFADLRLGLNENFL